MENILVKITIFKILMILTIITSPVISDTTDNKSFCQATAFKVEHFEWNEYIPYQPKHYKGEFVTENGPLYHLLSNWTFHNKSNFSLDLNTDFYWGRPKYLSHPYNGYYDTIFTESAHTQYTGMNLAIAGGFDFNSAFFRKIGAFLTPNIGLKYCGWKRALPWKLIFVTDTTYVTYWGYDENWHNFLITVGTMNHPKVCM